VTAFLIVAPSWPTDIWRQAMMTAAPALDVRVWPDMGAPEDISYVGAWLPPPGVLAGLPRLRVMFSLGAGVDALLRDETLPRNVPLVRVSDADLTQRMSEYVVLQVLWHHRQQRRIDDNQRRKVWDSFATHAAGDLRVGVMGLGVLGSDAAGKLAMMGFAVAGWSRTRKQIAGVQSFAGWDEFDAFLARSDVLVSLLPATAETRGIINYATLRKLARNGPFGAPIMINAGRGAQQVETDILRALDDGTLHAATLDVFETEPLPADSPLWTHPRVVVTPHAAADSDPAAICRYIAGQIARLERGEALHNVVDRQRGY
jgi:glyoxylate/hydroxypyruvate reductase A